MKVVKWILIGLAVAVVALGVTAYAMLASLETEELRGLIESEVEKATGRKLRLAGPIDLSISLTPAVVLNKVSFDNADWGSRPELLDIGRVAVQVDLLPLLQSRYVIERIVIEQADILLETDAAGEGNWALQTEAPDAPAEGGTAETASGKPVVPEVGSIVVRDSRLVYRDGATGESTLVSIDSLEITPEGEVLALALDGSYQETPLEVDGRIGGLAVLMGGGDLPVDLSGSLAGGEFSVEGRLNDIKGSATPELRIELAADSLTQFDRIAGAALPALGPLAFSGRLELDAGLVTLEDVALSLGDSDLAGSLSADLRGERPALRAELSGDRLDLSGLAAAAEAKQEPVSTAPADRTAAEGEQPQGEVDGEAAADSRYVIPDTPLPLALLRTADADVTLALAELIVDPKLTLREVDLALQLEDGRLEVPRLAARAFQGQLDATLSLDAGESPPPLSTRVELAGLSVGEVMMAYAGSEALESSLDLTLDLSGRGDSPRAIAASLNGSSELVGGEGVITNRILAIVATGLDGILGPLFGGQDQTRLNCLVSRFRFEDGVAVSQAQLLDSSTFSLAGAGTLDLRDESLDLKFETRTRQAALVSLAVPFVVKGTLKEPRPAPDALGTAMKAAEFVRGGSNPLAALGQVVAGEQAPPDGENGCLAALERTAEVPAEQTPIGSVRESLEKALEGEDARKALEDAEDALGVDIEKGLENLNKGLDGLFRRD